MAPRNCLAAITQAAAEGARAAAVTQTGSPEDQALAAVNSALAGYDLTCGTGGLTCTPTAASCGSASCMEVTVSYAYRANTPMPNLLPDSAFPHTTVTGTCNTMPDLGLTGRIGE